jgi:hypothetical protein
MNLNKKETSLIKIILINVLESNELRLNSEVMRDAEILLDKMNKKGLNK